MAEIQAQRTLVKSPPELWAELSDRESLAEHLGEFGEIRITRTQPESTVAWEGERICGTVSIEASGWGTQVSLTARIDAPEAETPPPAAPEPSAFATAPPAPAAPEPVRGEAGDSNVDWEAVINDLQQMTEDALGNRSRKVKDVLAAAEPSQAGVEAAIDQVPTISILFVDSSRLEALANDLRARLRNHTG